MKIKLTQYISIIFALSSMILSCKNDNSQNPSQIAPQKGIQLVDPNAPAGYFLKIIRGWRHVTRCKNGMQRLSCYT